MKKQAPKKPQPPKPKTQDDLDQELRSYMMQTPDSAKALLDNDLDSYFKKSTTESHDADAPATAAAAAAAPDASASV